MTRKQLCLLVGSLTTTHAQSASIAATSGNPSGGVGYAYNVALDASNNDHTTFSGTVGSWSWEDESLPAANNLWRHQSDWLAVTLTEDSVLRIQVERNDPSADAKLFPSFTIYENFNDTAEGDHFAPNTADIQWEINSQLLSYITHLDNSSSASIDESIVLSAGDYTILLGGNAESQVLAENVNYRAILSVPEPTSAFLCLLGGLTFVGRRKRL